VKNRLAEHAQSVPDNVPPELDNTQSEPDNTQPETDNILTELDNTQLVVIIFYLTGIQISE
jgi:hypothetical protein